MTVEDLVIYTKNNCTQCEATKTKLDTMSIPYHTINLDENPELIEDFLKLGFRSAPVVMIPSLKQAWSGYKPEKIEEVFGN